MEVECVFTRKVEPETYMNTTEAEILSSLQDVVSNFLEACQNASLVSIEETYMETGETVTPQPFLRAVVNCENDPEQDLIKQSVSIIGDLSYFNEDVFPVKLLGPSYWVDEDIAPSEEVTRDSGSEETESKSFVDRIVEFFYSVI